MDVPDVVREHVARLPKREDGTADYSHSPTAPVLNVFVFCKGELLLLRRSSKVGTYRGLWNCVGGYLDEVKPLRQKMLEELKEELGIVPDSLSIRSPYTFTDVKTWIVFPAIAQCSRKPDVKLDWEHSEYRWIEVRDLDSYSTVPKLKEVLQHAQLE